MAASDPQSTDISPVSLNEDVPTETLDVPEGVPVDVPLDVPGDVPEDIPEDVPEDVPVDVPLDVPGDVPVDVPEDGPEDVPVDVPEEVPEEAGGDQAAEGEQHLSSRDSSDWELQDESDGCLLLDSPERQGDTHPQEKPGASAAPGGALTEEDYVELLEQLLEQRDEALSHSRELQAKLPQYIKRKSKNFGSLDSHLEQQQMYQQNLKTLMDLKEQLVAEARRAERQTKELARCCQEKKEKVDAEWRAFLALKKKAAVPELSRRLGLQAARAQVDSILEEEQQKQEELVQERLKNIRLNTRIRRLEAALRGWEEQRDPVQVQFEQLQARRLEQKKQAEKDKERSMKMQQKIRSSLELLSNMKEKIFLSQTQVRLRREELVQLEAQVSRRRDLLLRTQQACSRLHQDNARLKVDWGLLGHRTLLQDLELTVDTSEGMEKHLEGLKQRHKAQKKGRGQPERRQTP